MFAETADEVRLELQGTDLVITGRQAMSGTLTCQFLHFAPSGLP